MLIKADGFIVITVEQPFAMQPCLINQTRQMNITAEFLVRTAWMQSSHELMLLCGRQRLRYRMLKTGLGRARYGRLLFREQFSLRQIDLSYGELPGKHPASFHANRPRCHIALQRTLSVDRYGLSNNLSRHFASDFDVLRAHPPKTVNVSFAINQYVPGSDAAWHFA